MNLERISMPNLQLRKTVPCMPGAGSVMRQIGKGHKETSLSDETVTYLDCGKDYQKYIFDKMVKYNGCTELYVNYSSVMLINIFWTLEDINNISPL